MARHINPEYLRKGMDIVKDMSGGVRTTRRDMWKFLVRNAEGLEKTDPEIVKNILGREMYLRGHCGFLSYSEVEIPNEVVEKLV